MSLEVSPLLAYDAKATGAETIFGCTIVLSSGRSIPTRWVGEQHVREDLGFIPSFADWIKAIARRPGWAAP